MPVYDFSKITAVQNSKDLIDTILYRTMRKTPTVVRRGFKISRIRSFYMLKVKFTQNTISQKLGTILDEFPKVDEVHPFYRYWFSVLYEKRHYKTALAQISVCKQLVDKCGQHYVKLLKHADSLFQCKSLKIAALGRMATMLRKLDAQFVYLEEVRAHMSRLAAIDPSARTVVLAGCPGAGKSSILNALSAANVDVQPWAFTTKSLLLGHCEHRGLRFQLVDSPGLLDRAMSERNQIEMQTLTALAYLNSAVLYVVDASTGAEFTRQQLALFRALAPFLENKPVAVLLNKMDSWRPDELTAEELELLQQFSPNFPLQETFRLAGIAYADAVDIRAAEKIGGVAFEQAAEAMKTEQALRDAITATGATPILCCSAVTRCGLERAAATVMDQLLAIRAAQSGRGGPKEVTGEGSAAIPGLFVARPPQAKQNDAWTGQTLVNRPPVVPKSVSALRKQHLHPRPLSSEDGRESLLERERAAGGSAQFFLDPRENWILEDETERYDQIPFMHNGKNVMDFVSADEDILELIKQLEAEEEVLAAQEEAKAKDDAELFARLGAFEKAVGFKGPGRSGKMLKWQRDRAERNAIRAIPKYLPEQVRKAEAKLQARLEGREFDEEKWDQAYKEATGSDRPLTSEGVNKGVLELVPTAKSMKTSAKIKLRKEFKEQKADKMPKHLYSGKMSLGTRAWR